jgi:hypothetical protein
MHRKVIAASSGLSAAQAVAPGQDAYGVDAGEGLWATTLAQRARSPISEAGKRFPSSARRGLAEGRAQAPQADREGRRRVGPRVARRVRALRPPAAERRALPVRLNPERQIRAVVQAVGLRNIPTSTARSVRSPSQWIRSSAKVRVFGFPQNSPIRSAGRSRGASGRAAGFPMAELLIVALVGDRSYYFWLFARPRDFEGLLPTAREMADMPRDPGLTRSRRLIKPVQSRSSSRQPGSPCGAGSRWSFTGSVRLTDKQVTSTKFMATFVRDCHHLAADAVPRVGRRRPLVERSVVGGSRGADESPGPAPSGFRDRRTG